jgi:arabinogalactan oligomer/maltooligosaccharide transport system permease protein
MACRAEGETDVAMSGTQATAPPPPDTERRAVAAGAVPLVSRARFSAGALPYILILPSMAILATVVLYPFLYTFWLAFRNMNLYHVTDTSFVGLQHFRRIFTQPVLYEVFAKTVVWTAANVVCHVVFGIALALLLNQPLPGRAVFRTLLVLPWALPQYITALTWRGMFNHQYGAVNLILTRLFHLSPVPWVSDPTWAFIAPIIANVWLGVPFMMVVALGGLQSIPREVYESAAIDGAGAWTRLRKITLPFLRPVMAPAIALGTIWTFNNLNVIWLVTDGGQPADRTRILVTYVYKAAFTYNDYSYAAAFSVVIFAILLVFVLLWFRANRAAETVL